MSIKLKRIVSIFDLPETRALITLSRDGRFLFATPIIRLFAYGLLSVVLALYLTQIGLGQRPPG
jgi:hypothetical protein